MAVGIFLFTDATQAHAASSVTLDQTTLNTGQELTGTVTPDGTLCSGATGLVKYQFMLKTADGTGILGVVMALTPGGSYVFTPGSTEAFKVDFNNPLTATSPAVVNLEGVQVAEIYCFDDNTSSQLGAQVVSGATFNFAVETADSTVQSGSNWTITPAGGAAGLDAMCGGFYSPAVFSMAVQYEDASGTVTSIPSGWSPDGAGGDPTGDGYAVVDSSTTSVTVPTTGLAAGDYTATVWCMTSDNGLWVNWAYQVPISVTAAPALAETGANVFGPGLAAFTLLLLGGAAFVIRARAAQ